MKLNKVVMLMAATVLTMGTANAADNAVSKKITLTAEINDSIFVSKPDGSSWYNTEALDAKDYTQSEFSKVLPIRIHTKNPDFKISLAQPLTMTSANYRMKDAKVTIGTTKGDLAVNHTAPQTVTQTTKMGTDYDDVYNLTVNVKAPTTVGELSTNGSYSGDLVMLFEPTAAVTP